MKRGDNVLHTHAVMQDMADPWRYVASCRLADGGYFFARVMPSSLRDTYFALECFRVGGQQPPQPEETVRFLLDRYQNEPPASIYGIFFLVEGLALLGFLVDRQLAACAEQVYQTQGREGGFGATPALDVAVSSELETTFLAVKVLATLRQPVDADRVGGFIMALRNPDGGFGSHGRSALATTYYALATLDLLGRELEDATAAVNYLSQLERRGPYLYIEQAYWLTSAFAYVGAKPRYPYRLAAFVRACQRPNGGFARAAAIGITTLECTYYALATLEALQVENITRYIDPMDGHPYNSSNQ